jgi:hypothetical protein
MPGGEQGDVAFDSIEDLSPKTPEKASVKRIALGLAPDIAKTRYLNTSNSRRRSRSRYSGC